MATATTVQPITIEQYERFEGYPGARDELIRGRIVMSPQPKPLHQEIARRIERLLERVLGEDGSYVPRQNSNVKFPQAHSMPAPDVFVVTRESWDSACETEQYLAGPPALVVEVVSPANRRKAVDEKVSIYLEAGVPQVWVVHPNKKTVRIYEPSHAEGVEASVSVKLAAPLQGTVSIKDLFRLRR